MHVPLKRRQQTEIQYLKSTVDVCAHKRRESKTRCDPWTHTHTHTHVCALKMQATDGNPTLESQSMDGTFTVKNERINESIIPVSEFEHTYLYTT